MTYSFKIASARRSYWTMIFLTVLFLFLLPELNNAQEGSIKIKKLQSTNFGIRSKYNICILPFFYDSATVSDRQIMQAIDTLPRRSYMKILREKQYYLLYKTDTNRIAILAKASKHSYNIGQFHLDGSFKRITFYDRLYNKTGVVDFYEDGIHKQESYYKNQKRSGDWIYFDDHGYIVKVETYRNDGLVKTRRYNRHTAILHKGGRSNLELDNYQVL